ncbi:MAG: cell division protein ZapB [Spirochaetaceae bacterium]|nr:MAG: cell division protein ZapB [Spirochaetaceae bacterium]
MLTVEQIKLLESRVLKAVERISSLQNENQRLRDGLSQYERRIEELEVLISEFRDGQKAIEEGILSTLKRLDVLEDEIAVDDGAAEQVAAAPVDSVTEAETADIDETAAVPEGSPAADEEPDENPETESESELDIF